MTKLLSSATEHIAYHKAGTIRAKGQVVGNVAEGYWQWFRKDGTLMRSGYFSDGYQVGEWTTYDANGQVYKVTDMRDVDTSSDRTLIDCP